MLHGWTVSSSNADSLGSKIRSLTDQSTNSPIELRMNTVVQCPTHHVEHEHWRTKIVAATRAFLWLKKPLFNRIIDPSKTRPLAVFFWE
jgi:hypothetical protein